MKKLIALTILAGLLESPLATRAASTEVPSYVSAAVADPSRPPRSRSHDDISKPAELLTLIGLKPGNKIIDVFPGKYWDWLFSDVVGPTGQVYVFISTEYSKGSHLPIPTSSVWIPGHTNITWNAAPLSLFGNVEPVDIVWMRQNYHDLYDPFMGPADVPAFDKAVYKALKPGGIFVIVDHAAKDGVGVSQTNTLHRIDPAIVRRDMAAAGFTFAGESDVLRNPADLRTKVVWDPSFKGRTDQFVYLFRKPR